MGAWPVSAFRRGQKMSPYFYVLIDSLITAAGVYIAYRKGWIH